MALKPCRECGKEVSSSAKVCPSCGIANPVPENAAHNTLAGFAVIILVSVGLFFYGTREGSDPPPSPPAKAPTPKTEAEKKHDAASSMAAAGAKMLRDATRDPQSFKLESAIITSDNAICYSYRAKNGFGGTNVLEAVWTHDRKKFVSSEQEGFVTAWNRECANKSGSDQASNIRLLMSLE